MALPALDYSVPKLHILLQYILKFINYNYQFAPVLTCSVLEQGFIGSFRLPGLKRRGNFPSHTLPLRQGGSLWGVIIKRWLILAELPYHLTDPMLFPAIEDKNLASLLLVILH